MARATCSCRTCSTASMGPAYLTARWESGTRALPGQAGTGRGGPGLERALYPVSKVKFDGVHVCSHSRPAAALPR